MSVDLRTRDFPGIRLGEDQSSDEALAAAHDLLETFGDELCAVEAMVDRFNGLVLVFEQPSISTWPGWHFQSAICGYTGAGPITSAQILSLFGFGRYDEIYERISKGGDVNFTFTK